MQSFSFDETELSGVYRIQPFYSDDARGYFMKDFASSLFAANSGNFTIMETFYASNCPGVLRGIHFLVERQQSKLVQVLCGKIYDVVVDFRKDSPTHRKWISFELSAENHTKLLIPGGCGHGYYSPVQSIVSYQCDTEFSPECDQGIRWDDPDLAVDWPVRDTDALIISEKDSHLGSYRQFMDKFGGLE